MIYMSLPFTICDLSILIIDMNDIQPNSSLAYVWLMATFSAKAAKVQRRDIIATDISSVCNSISRARAVALHTSSNLLHGTTILYDLKASYLLSVY